MAAPHPPRSQHRNTSPAHVPDQANEPNPLAGAVSGRDLRNLPKAHLHLHFTGSMRVETLVELADLHGVSLPAQLRTQDVPQLDPSARGWFRFQRLYDAARAVVRSADDMRRIVLEAAQDDAAEGSGWLEMQIDPTSYARFVGGLAPAIEVALAAADEATASTGTSVAIIIATSRMRHPLDGRTLARLAVRYAGNEAGTVVGFGLSNDERRGDTREFEGAFRIAREAGLSLVPHSGELLGPDHIETTLQSLQPNRLGHGVRSAEDPDVLQRIVDSGVALEVCPGSNVALGVYPTMADVPLRRLYDADAMIALGADDPLIFGTRLVDQYESARHDHGFSDEELADLARSSIVASNAPAAVKHSLLSGVNSWLAAPAGQRHDATGVSR